MIYEFLTIFLVALASFAAGLFYRRAEWHQGYHAGANDARSHINRETTPKVLAKFHKGVLWGRGHSNGRN